MFPESSPSKVRVKNLAMSAPHIDKSLKCLESYREKCLGKRVIRDNQASDKTAYFTRIKNIVTNSINCDVLSDLLYLLSHCNG